MLIVGTYADGLLDMTGRPSSIPQVRSYLDSILEPCVAVHVLPVCPAAGDSGFAPNDWCDVRPELGDWQDVAALASTRPLLLDGIYNHVGIGHRWVTERLSSQRPMTDSIFYEFSQHDAELAPRSPRGGSVLRPHMARGGLVYFWQTFSDAAIDVRVNHGAVLEEIARHLDLLSGASAWGVRLDAVAYYMKALDGPVRHVDGVHALASHVATLAEIAGWSWLPSST